MAPVVTVKQLKDDLKKLGAKTCGNKKELEDRLFKWKENKLDNVLVETRIIATTAHAMPVDGYLPLNSVKGTFMNISAIEEWFFKRTSEKGYKKGRVLAMKLFVKNGAIQMDNKIVYFIARCAAEQKKSIDYKVCIVIHTESTYTITIKQCSCSCPAGAGWSASCKHVSAVCFSLEYYSLTGKTQEYVSCTSEQMQWNKPVPQGRGLTYMSLNEINKVPNQVYEPNDYLTTVVQNSLISYGTNSAILENRRVNSSAFINDHSLYTKDFCFNKLQKINFISVNQRSDYEEKTRNQSTSKLWLQLRRSRITSSIMGDVMRTVKSGHFSKGPALRNIVHNKKLQYVKSIKWGLEHEDVAKSLYCDVTGNKINNSGIWIDHIVNFIAASPDGVSFPLDLVLEIKCPYSIRDSSPFEAKCLVKHRKGSFLNRKHAYYAQCQAHMFATNTDRCDFVIYTKQGIYIELIKRNERFMDKMVAASSLYFKGVFAPEYVKFLYMK